MAQTRTADEVAHLFLDRSKRNMAILSPKQMAWLAALAKDSKETHRHSHGHNSVDAGTTYTSHWSGVFCAQCETRWQASESAAKGIRQISADFCYHYPDRGPALRYQGFS